MDIVDCGSCPALDVAGSGFIGVLNGDLKGLWRALLESLIRRLLEAGIIWNDSSRLQMYIWGVMSRVYWIHVASVLDCSTLSCLVVRAKM